MKIAYITAQAPFGPQETFVFAEINAVLELGADLVIIPRNPPRDIFHDRAKPLVRYTLRFPLIDYKILLAFIKELVSISRIWRIAWRVFIQSRSLGIALKNFAVLPKAAFIAKRLIQSDVRHIHAHWASTTATMAWAVSEMTGISWSFTLHRWDIAENNLLRLKVEHASFARCIAEDGRREVLGIVGKDLEHKVRVLHLGVPISEEKAIRHENREQPFTIACPANLVYKKGHRYLILACAELIKRRVPRFQVLIIGDGPLDKEIRNQVKQLNLEETIKLIGRLPHEQLMQLYYNGAIDTVVLPSIETERGEREGIPVALMEAMAIGIPVITTNTGGTDELVGNGAGLVVPQRNPERLADAIEYLMRNEDLSKRLAEVGRQRVRDQFDLFENTKTLLDWIKESC